jgi:hypothetical protein
VEQQSNQTVDLAPPRATGHRSRSRSRTPTGSRAWGSTPSPPPGLHGCGYPASLTMPSPLEDGFAAVHDAAPSGMHAASQDSLVHFITNIPPPPPPLIPWEEIPGLQPGLGNGGLEDQWSANINSVQADEPRTYYPLSPAHLRSPLHKSPDQHAVDHWAAFFGEQSAEYVPSSRSLHEWQGMWMDDPLPSVQPQPDLLQPHIAGDDRMPGSWGVIHGGCPMIPLPF